MASFSGLIVPHAENSRNRNAKKTISKEENRENRGRRRRAIEGERVEMASNNNVNGGGKEERRRRIAERGSDRMALITGRIHSLPPTPPSPPTTTHHHHHNHRQPPRHAQSLSYHSDSDNHLPSRHSRPQSLSPAFYSDYQEEDHTGIVF